METQIVIPGDRLGSCSDYRPGFGTHVRHGFIYSSMTGYKSFAKGETSSSPTVVSVYKDSSKRRVVPIPGTVVICRVMSTNPRHCKVSIVAVGDVQLKESFRGLIRKEDVRAMEKDKVEMYKCFRPGDIVRAKVNSLGDAQSYLLTTAENSLGVIHAESEAGVAMVAVSWEEMQCPKSKVKQWRKVAKPTT